MVKLQLYKKTGHGRKTVSHQYHVTIPLTFVKTFQWTKGMELSVMPGKEERTLIVKEMPKQVPFNE